MIDTVRTRVLNMALEIKSEIGKVLGGHPKAAM
jgi:hypothetical protein